uniref:Putative ABC transport system permease protein n=1 Tax=Candidatus Kentrum sp. FW TaxID=2126338 RepID=A0A450SIJ5_9GAMM|nr:MAG: putative ABC transport system permease protein [Candidatus Kentron sp. FW]VFJ55688.1 MAG: putative ABC transport system permease protein [Candidatus Kentron sp. FW]
MNSSLPQADGIIARWVVLRSDIHQCVRVATANTFHLPRRTVAAIAGIGFSFLLVFMQLGFLNTARIVVTRLYGYCDFDLAIVAREYQFLYETIPFHRVRLSQARALPEVEATFALNVRGADWLNTRIDRESSLMLIGLDRDPRFIANPDIEAALPMIRKGQRAILDTLSHGDYGDLAIGGNGLINGFLTKVVGHFQLGMFFFTDGAAIVDNGEFIRLSGVDSRQVTIGLIRLTEGARPRKVAEALDRLLPEDVLIYTRASLIAQEQDYFISVRPIGILFRMGAFISYLVGLVILYQILATEMANHIREFATLRAMGFRSRFIYGIGIIQAMLFISMAFLPALATAYGVFESISTLTPFPITMTPTLILSVLGLSLGTCFISAPLALSRLRRADPAELF